ncbi:protein phosphatase 1 regulatory subunit 37-like [Actinia tenebrosa]|uniref:Protein phosphatase 1 regulatory subunit 37-like n=1 Tax=Actinia tenebrosa TaxID=6105 RepID=A0A6P8HYX8_ACTTE|nr:protein phosphatase 1 regulatory subunit 37-like [Actinia tenebrosa]
METGEDVLASAESTSGSDGVFSSANESHGSGVVASDTSESPGKNRASSKQQRKVYFPDDDSLVHSLEPFDPWKNVGNYTSEEVIDAYRSICSQLKVKPCEKLIKQLEACESFKERIDVIDLRGTKLDLKSCETLEEVLRKVRTNTLDLENTSLEDEGTLSILEMVEFYHSTCKLNLAYNNKIRVRGWQALSRTIKRTPCLEYLDVRHTVWTEQSIPFLGRSLRLNCPLTILHMEATNLSGRPLFLLANAIKSNQNLRDLFLGDNKLVPSDGQCIGAMLKGNEMLRLLDLRNNSLQDMGLGYICEGLVHQTQGGLQTLVLWNNQLTFHGMVNLGAALVPLKSLQTLNLGHNRLTNEGIHMLKDGLHLNKSLQRLGLLNTRLTSEGIIALAEVIADSKTMLRLDIRENDPYVGGLMALALSLKMNYSLVRIDLDKELKKEPGMETTQRILLADIYSYCQRNKALTEGKSQQSSVMPGVTPSVTPSVTPGVTSGITQGVTTGATQTDSGAATNERSSAETPCTSNDQPLIQLDNAPNRKEEHNMISKNSYPMPSRFRITRIYEGSDAVIPETSSGENSSGSEGEGLLVEIEPSSPAGISSNLENLELFDLESDSSSSQDTDSDSKLDNLPTCGSKESVDSMGTPFERPTGVPDRGGVDDCGFRSKDSVDSMGTPTSRPQEPIAALMQDHPAHDFERELDAMLASVNNSQQQANDNEFWFQQMDGIYNNSNNTNSNSLPTNPPTGDLLGS